MRALVALAAGEAREARNAATGRSRDSSAALARNRAGGNADMPVLANVGAKGQGADRQGADR